MFAISPLLAVMGTAALANRYLLIAALAITAATARGDADTYARVVQSTVWIVTSDANNETATGTGVLVDAEKRIVITNAHVVGDSRTAVVFFADIKDGLPNVKRKHYLDNVLKLAQPGKVVAVDRRRDLALIQLPNLPDGAKAIEMSENGTKPGSTIELVGNPGNSDVMWVSTSGSVRAVYDKKFKSNHGEHNFRAVETQSPIQPGDSGGPIVDGEGKLVALAQSFSPDNSLISFCVDITEIRALLDSSWKQAPIASKKLLQDADIQHTVTAAGHYQVDHPLADKTTQTVFVAKDTEYFERADVRKIWSLVQVSKDQPSTELMNRLLRQSSVTKIGAWAIEKNDAGEHLVIYVAKLDATAPDEAIKGTIEYVARIAAAMAKELKPKADEKSAAETLASWLAK
ncbi:S1 family peptidase [Rubripirellula reticaptiva]|uniref:Periplasmic serine endoprotease DegP n=1 Tax=Rubripirellula reticaptiva TaxID=2528013 RepID=A0A5C6ERP6_9BACT|nr:serine protease [Rubripirellula reticaptiva]TWU51628.1 Periplasmic serine endoprotease DegP precursor [Rubripirellula reticaptiva]